MGEYENDLEPYTPSIRAVELTVGDATLTFAPDEVARIIVRLIS